MILLKDIYFRLGDKNIFNGLSLHVHSKKINTIIGNNGCGKSTLLKIMVGFWEPDSGSVDINGVSLTRENKHLLLDDFGVLVENPRLYAGLSVKENILYKQLETGFSHDNIDSFLTTFNLLKFENTKCSHLSVGNRLKLGLALTLLKKPSCLILDEPTSSLDPAATIEFGQLLLKIKSEFGTTICLTSHDNGLVERVSDQIINLGTVQYEKAEKFDDEISKKFIKKFDPTTVEKIVSYCLKENISFDYIGNNELRLPPEVLSSPFFMDLSKYKPH